MRSASRGALRSAQSVLTALGSDADLATGEEILSAGRTIASSQQLLGVVADPTADATGKQGIVNRVFVSRSEATRAVLRAVVATRWSSPADLLAGVEDLGIRTIAASAPAGTSIESELFTFEAAVRSDADLELALGTKLGSTAQKSALVGRLLGGKASAQTVAILGHLVQQPRGRRIGELVRAASEIVADQADKLVATVVSAVPLNEGQSARVARGLATKYGRDVSINAVIDPSVVGGIRVQVGGDVIDGTVSTRLSDLKLQLAG